MTTTERVARPQMQDNFLLSEQAKALKPREAAALGRDEAYERFKDVRFGWTGGLAVCPHCGHDRIYEHNNRLTFKCKRCWRHFSVTSLTPFHARKLSFGQLLHLVSLRLRGQNAMTISHEMNVNYRTAWAQKKRLVLLGNGAARTRDRAWPYRPDNAPADEGLAGKVAKLTLGLPWQMRGDVAQEADETFIGRKEGTTPARGTAHKRVVLALVERGAEVRMFHVDKADTKSIRPIVEANVARESRLMTDQARYYLPVGKAFASHETVDHSAEEYVRGDVTTNTAEGVFSIFKRGMKGIYQHCGERHLHRYLNEFEFRYNNRSRLGIEDAERAANALRGIVGKRLTYRWPH